VGELPTRLQHTQPFTTGQESDRPGAAYRASVAAADVRPTACWPAEDVAAGHERQRALMASNARRRG